MIIRRRLQFEHDPQSFRAQYADEQEALKGRLKRAQACLRRLTLSDSMLTIVAEFCQAANVSSLRADLVLARSALAYAALHGADEVMLEHIEQVVPFVLTHRQADVTSPRPQPPALSPPQDPWQNSSTSEATDESRADPPGSAGVSQSFQPEQTFAIGAPLEIAVPYIGSSSTHSGRRKSVVEAPHGRVTRSVRTPRPQHLAVADSLRYAITRTALSGQDLDTLTSDDLHSYQHQGSRSVRLLLVVDSSGSLAARKRMASVKGLIASMLDKAYQQREEVSLIAFRSTRAECTVPWTRDTDHALAALEALPTGGRTPLAHALELAHSLIEDSTETTLILFTDGKSNVPLNPGGDPWQDVLNSAERLRKAQTVIIDTEEGNVRLARARELANALGAEYILLGAPDAQNVT
jgi:magnesium chelatase subunit D